mgnify:FL=1
MEITEPRGVVYRVKRSGPSTEPCGTPQAKLEDDEIESEIVTACERKEIYEENQLRTVLSSPNQLESRLRRIE